MPKRLARLVALLLAVGLLPAPAAAQQSSLASLQALVAPFYAQLAALRGLPAPGSPPPVVIRSRSETRRYVEQELNRKYPPADVEAEQKAMIAWGLVPADFDLRGFYLDLMEEQAAAYYDPVGKVMVLADWLTPEQQQSALLHELVHALQDREISLDRFVAPSPRGRGDQLLAREALIEGEAVAVSLEVILKPQGLDFQKLPDLSSLQQLIAAQSIGPVVDRAPKYIKDLLLFPYTHGLAFVHQFRQRRPWSAMSALYRDPPRSTTQILHPDKFFDQRQDPLAITLADLSGALPSGWRLLDDDELGEWALSEVLERHVGEATARRLATGWRGDRYQVWEAASAGPLLVYRVAWETEAIAEAFAQAYAGVMEKKYPTLAGKASRSPGSAWAWQDGPQRFLVERRGLEVVVLERVPANAAERIRQSFWPSRSTEPAPIY
ncbi:MAG: hypothetical protein HYU24_15420 [Candidatus Rokubacteria bacterium]|nr:hypothetical protein [Candidatus Rokubacteria bacterium]